LFGIVSPGDTAGPVPATPIDEAKAMIDQLAGDNSLGHNFIKDPRVVGWRTSNELNINDSEIYDWNIELCDYIRSKGGTVWISSPTAGGGSDNYDFHLTEPMLRGHVDYLEAHYYEVRDYVLYCNKDYTTFYNWYKNVLQNKMVSGRGSFDLDHVILGEFGIWSGYGSDLGIEATFTDEERRDYYQAVLDAARDAGIKNVMLHDFFAQKYADGTYETPNYGVVDVDGSHYPYVADVINEVYTS